MPVTARKHKSPSDIRHAARSRDKRLGQRNTGRDIPRPPSDCVDCGRTDHRITDGAEIYPHRSDLAHKRFLICECGAYVGFHVGTDVPLGRPAGTATQRARREAHEAFDRLWLLKAEREGCGRGQARGAAYRWLAESLGIEPHACHIGWMTADQARRVTALCRSPRAQGGEHHG